jgi:ferredoxin-thioredoxin reductase catalytic chain
VTDAIPVRRRFPAGTTVEDLKAFMEPFAARLGYKFNTETEFVDEVLASEIDILESTGDIYCPCRVRSGNPKEDAKIVCPCIPFFRDQFAGIRKCWCGLFILNDVEDGAELLGVIEEPEGSVDVPVFRTEDLPDGQIRHVKVGRHDMAIARVGDEFFALSNVCRHAFAPLGEGFMDGYHVLCPWHGWRYDVRDGSTDHPDADVRTFRTSVVAGEIRVTVPARG